MESAGTEENCNFLSFNTLYRKAYLPIHISHWPWMKHFPAEKQHHALYVNHWLCIKILILVLLVSHTHIFVLIYEPWQIAGRRLTYWSSEQMMSQAPHWEDKCRQDAEEACDLESLCHSSSSAIYCVTLFKRGYKNHVIWIHSSVTRGGCKAGRRIQELFNNVSSPGCYRDTM